MRILHIALFGAASVLSLSCIAAPQGAPATVTELRVAQPTKVYIDPTMYKNMQTTYKLDDGRTLRVTEKGRKLYADLGNGPSEIIHVGKDRFVGVTEDISLRFDDGPYPETVHVNSGPARQLASAQR